MAEINPPPPQDDQNPVIEEVHNLNAQNGNGQNGQNGRIVPENPPPPLNHNPIHERPPGPNPPNPFNQYPHDQNFPNFYPPPNYPPPPFYPPYPYYPPPVYPQQYPPHQQPPQHQQNPPNQNQNQGRQHRPPYMFQGPPPEDCAYTQNRPSVHPYVAPPNITARDFELKTGLIQMIQTHQFAGRPQEDPHAHLKKFLEISNTIRFRNVDQNDIRTTLFPHSLRDQAIEWIETLAPEQRDHWDTLVACFLEEYFPQSKVMDYQQQIASFIMRTDEEFWDAWKRFKMIVRKCPQHEYPSWKLVQYFYNGLPPPGQNMLNSRAPRDILEIGGDQA